MNAAGGQTMPIFTDDEIARLFAPLATASGLLLAVSGGPDSLALLLLTHRWRARGEVPPIAVASVDHGLRPDGAAEVAAVAALCARLGLPHRTLLWRGPKPRAGLQEAARTARYGLLAEAARDLGASHIVTAHHRDDQAETVLMRLARGSGIGGLAAMRPLTSVAPDLILARPLLAVPKPRLVALVEEAGISAADDPSNRDPRFARAVLRREAEARAALGLTDERLSLLAARAARADETLETVAGLAFARLADRQHDQGEAGDRRVVLAPAFFGEGEEIRLRVLRRAILEVTGATALDAHRLRLERLEDMAGALEIARADGLPLKRSLGGALLTLDRNGQVDLVREGPRRRGRPR
ncbi:tRNA lysidine(34) synthetase TilS [Chelatococcus sp. GCM10030263]|uniref:tRNA lysidine(34) synthetase TilS n=1 Tax=Chelatococcus sp. GCM10030263 TaxID=3273387 RepID=UPI003617FFB6